MLNRKHGIGIETDSRDTKKFVVYHRGNLVQELSEDEVEKINRGALEIQEMNIFNEEKY